MQKISNGPLKGIRLMSRMGFNLLKSCAIFFLRVCCQGVKTLLSIFSVIISLKYCSRSFLNEKNPSLAMCRACFVYISVRWTAVLPWDRSISSKAFLLMQLQRMARFRVMILWMAEASIVVLFGQLIVDKSHQIPILLFLSRKVKELEISELVRDIIFIFRFLQSENQYFFGGCSKMTTFSTSLFNFDEIQLQMLVMDDDFLQFRLVDPRQHRRIHISEQTPFGHIVQTQRQTIFYSDEEQEEQDGPKVAPPAGPQLESREDVGNSTITEQGSHSPSNREEANAERQDSARYKRNGDPQVNKSDTKNYISFVWKKILRVMNSEEKVRESHWWRKFTAKHASLEVLSELFAEEGAAPHLKRIFEDRCFFRQIMLSPIDAHKKKVYISYLRSIYRGFLGKKIEYLK